MVNKERMCCRVGFSEEFTAVFHVKISQIDTENDKNPKKTPSFQRFYVLFPQFSTNFDNCNFETCRQRKNVLSSMLRKEINAVF